jgi:hypothetical protein
MLQRIVSALATTALLPVIVACGASDSAKQHAEPERISVTKAEELVRAMFLSEKPDMDPTVEFPLREFTTDEMWQRMGIQVFQVSGGIYEYYTYVIADDRVEQLGEAFGGSGVTSIHVTDLDRDVDPELTYTYSWGSGIHRSQVAVYSAAWPESASKAADVAYLGDLTLEKVSDQEILVRVDPTVALGRVTLEREDDRIRVVLRLADDLPQRITDRIVR